MSIVTANTGVNNSSTVASTSARGTDPNKDRDTFLLLLTTQLQNQDPTNPTDTNQVTQQIAALSQVEQQTKTNANLEKLIGIFTQGQVNTAVNYIGRQIDAEGNQLQLEGGRGIINYTLPAGATSSEVSISDKSGKVVYSGAGTIIAGRNIVIWDGKNKFTGEAMPKGAYTFQVTAKNAEGKEVTATPMVSGVVRSVDSKDGKQTVSLGDVSVELTKILSTYNPTTIQTVSN